MKTVGAGRLQLLPHDGVDERRELAAAASAREADQVGGERRVDALAALVRGHARELEDVVDVVLRER